MPIILTVALRASSATEDISLTPRDQIRAVRAYAEASGFQVSETIFVPADPVLKEEYV